MDDTTPMNRAARDNDVAALQSLLASGESPNQCDGFGRPPLHFAAASNAANTVQVLLQAGASITARDSFGNTPYMLGHGLQPALRARLKAKSVWPVVLIAVGVSVVLLPVIAAIVLPSLLPARRNSNQSAAMATAKNFSVAAVDYKCQFPEEGYWDDGTTDFGKYFTFVLPRAGYNYRYYAADANGRPASGGNAVKFVFLAWPVSYSTGRRAYYCDETICLWEAQIDSTSEVNRFSDWVPPNGGMINWSAGPDQSRLAASGTEFRKK